MELHDLMPVLAAQGPFVTVHVESESDVEQAADKYELEWKNILAELGEKGVDAPTLQAVGSARGDHAEGASRLVVASTADAEVKLAVSLPQPPRRPLVDVSALPHLLPVVEDVTTRVPHIVLRVDRTGADVSAFFDADTVADEITVRGQKTIYRNPAAGSWKHLYHQFPVEHGWMNRISKDVADAVAQLAQDVGAELVIGAGDVRVLSGIEEELPPALRPQWRTVEGGRGRDGSGRLIRQRVHDLLAEHVALKSLDLLEDYAQERGQLKRACDGVADVVAALRKAQVQTLLVTTEAPDGQTLWFGTEPGQVATTATELRDLGVDDPSSGPLVDVLVRAAIATGADVQVVPHQLAEAPRGGVGALLRYADSDTGEH